MCWSNVPTHTYFGLLRIKCKTIYGKTKKRKTLGNSRRKRMDKKELFHFKNVRRNTKGDSEHLALIQLVHNALFTIRIYARYGRPMTQYVAKCSAHCAHRSTKSFLMRFTQKKKHKGLGSDLFRIAKQRNALFRWSYHTRS